MTSSTEKEAQLFLLSRSLLCVGVPLCLIYDTATECFRNIVALPVISTSFPQIPISAYRYLWDYPRSCATDVVDCYTANTSLLTQWGMRYYLRDSSAIRATPPIPLPRTSSIECALHPSFLSPLNYTSSILGLPIIPSAFAPHTYLPQLPRTLRMESQVKRTILGRYLTATVDNTLLNTNFVTATRLNKMNFNFNDNVLYENASKNTFWTAPYYFIIQTDILIDCLYPRVHSVPWVPHRLLSDITRI